jgi:hypothetical protein
MSKAALVIEQMIQEKEKELNDHIRNNKDVMVKFAKLRGELEELKQTRYNIAKNRIGNIIAKDGFTTPQSESFPAKNIRAPRPGSCTD